MRIVAPMSFSTFVIAHPYRQGVFQFIEYAAGGNIGKAWEYQFREGLSSDWSGGGNPTL